MLRWGFGSEAEPPYGTRRAVRQVDGTLLVLERWKAKGETVVLVPEPR